MAFEQNYWSILLRVLLLCLPAVAQGNDAAAPANRSIPVDTGLQELVDPTRPLAFIGPANGGPGEAERKLQLQAVYHGESRREAVINGRTVKVGDVVDHARILAIGPGRVRYVKNGQEGELVLLPRVLQPIRGED